jgi:hypothetical protein
MDWRLMETQIIKNSLTFVDMDFMCDVWWRLDATVSNIGVMSGRMRAAVRMAHETGGLKSAWQ